LIVSALALSACGAQSNTAAAEANGLSSAQPGGLVIQGSAGQSVGQGIVVIGTGTVSAEPQVAQITVGVELRGDDPARIVADAAERIGQVTGTAEETGIAAEDIRTAGYNMWVENIYDPERGVPTGEVIYHVSHYVELRLRDVSRVGQLLADVVGAGANSISGITFTVEEQSALMEEARAKAIGDAAAKAEQIAEIMGVELGRPILVSDVSTSPSVPFGGGMAMEAAAPSISPGSFTVSASVQIAYEIRQTD
jgi:uncharacterized protein YggE